MRYKYLKYKKKLNQASKHNLTLYLFKWLKQNKTLKLNKTLLFVLLKKTTRIKKNQFHNICYLTWRTRGLINPILLSKTTFRFFANNNIFSSLKKK